jgi:hypothetical protein
MQERVKIFTFLSGHGAALLDPPVEEQINRWLTDIKGTLVNVSQSESERTGAGQHVTVCLWYIPGGEPA